MTSSLKRPRQTACSHRGTRSICWQQAARVTFSTGTQPSELRLWQLTDGGKNWTQLLCIRDDVQANYSVSNRQNERADRSDRWRSLQRKQQHRSIDHAIFNKRQARTVPGLYIIQEETNYALSSSSSSVCWCSTTVRGGLPTPLADSRPGHLFESIDRYLGSAVDVVRIFLLTSGQWDVGDVLYWVGQSQQHLALLNRHKEKHLNSLFTVV